MLEHGGKLHEAARRFGRPLHDWLDLSTGINPHFYPIPALRAQAWHRLPEKSPELLAAAQAYYGAGNMLAVAGTQAAIQALPKLRMQAAGLARVVVSAPSYAEHAHQWRRGGHAVQELAYEELAAATSWADVVVLCNPNNPTGASVEAAQLLHWARQLHARGGWLVVDEAFVDMQSELSVVVYADAPGLIVLRSPGKFFGLAGLRLGFVAAEAALLQALEEELGPWAVSGPAQEIAIAALRDQTWQQQTRQRLNEQGGRLRSLLAGQGWRSSGTDLFQWCSDAALDGQTEQLWQHFAQQGIWVRLFAEAAHGLRFGLPGDQAGWHRLEQALQAWRKRKA
jgi:cobalamin biosynthetic protein CobC